MIANFSGEPAQAAVQGICICDVMFHRTTMDELIQNCDRWIAAGKVFRIALANPEFVVEANHNPFLSEYLAGCDRVVADGVGILLAARLLSSPLPERITGTDFLPRLWLLAAKRGYSMFFLGGEPGIADHAIERMAEVLGCKPVVESHHGFFDPAETDRVSERISAFKPDILMVCLGNPRQEKWIADRSSAIGAKLTFGNGGALDFMAGRVRRAPLWMREYGLEWLFRLSQDFGWARLGRQSRLIVFMAMVLREVLLRRRK